MGTSLQNDMLCLLESLYCLNEDKNQQIQALELLAEMCLQEQGDVIFNRINGVSVVSKITFGKKCVSSTVVQKAFITLGNAVLQCDENKNILCTDQILEIIHSKMLSEEQDKKMIASIAYLLSCLCSNSEKAQNKMRKSKCLEKFALLYRYHHPKGNSDGSPVEEWFDKASSSSPIILNHISHALKAMMNKPRNGENQIACSRLLNLALSTLNVSAWSIEAKVEALQFIADCLYENEKCLNIFNMIGGVRLLSQLLRKELAQKRKNTKEWMLYLNAILDTTNVIVSDHGLSDKTLAATSFIDSLLTCLLTAELDSLHLKCLMCLSEMVHENELCQKKLVLSNGVPDIINFMSKKQDDITSKVGTTILQSCVKTLAGLDDFEKEYKDKQEQKEGIKTSSDERNDKLKQIMETLKDVDGAAALQNVLMNIENENGVAVEEKSGINLRRGKRFPNDGNGSKNNKNRQQNNVMIEMLKSQHELLQKFQDDVTCLRAEVRSQSASNYGDNWNQTNRCMTPSKSSAHVRQRSTPSKRLYQNICPSTEPRKRRQITNTATSYTPQPSYRRTYATCRPHVHIGSELAGKNHERRSNLGSSVHVVREEQHNIHDDEERPALTEPAGSYSINKSHDACYVDSSSNEMRSLNRPPEYRVPSVYEKVTRWQKKTFHQGHETDQDGFQIPIFTPSERCSNGFNNPSRSSLIPRPVKHLHYKTTPTMEKKTENQTIQNAPKKQEPTKRRRPTSPVESFVDEPQTPGESIADDQGTRRSLNFESFVSFNGDRNNNNALAKPRKLASERCSSFGEFHKPSSKCDKTKADNVVEDSTMKLPHQPPQQKSPDDVCLGCRPLIRQLNSRNFFTVLQKGENTCDFHFDMCYKIKEKSVMVKASKKDVCRTPLTKKLYLMPKKKLDLTPKKRLDLTPKHQQDRELNLPKKKLVYGNTNNVETMSVFSFRSNNTSLKEQHTLSVCSISTRYTNTSSTRRQRKNYSEEEVNYILHGVERYGRRWKVILNAYPFKDGRQANDLSDKYKKLIKSKMARFRSTSETKMPVPFTTEELVNLKLGVRDHGEEWNDILREYSFDASRTPHQLKDKWDTLIKQPCTS